MKTESTCRNCGCRIEFVNDFERWQHRGRNYWDGCWYMAVRELGKSMEWATERFGKSDHPGRPLATPDESYHVVELLSHYEM